MNSLPVVQGLPILGNLLEYRNQKIQFLSRLRDQYGDRVVFKLGKHSLILVTHPDEIQWIEAKNSKNYVKATNLRELIGDGIFMSEGEKWKKQRRLIQPTFHQSSVMRMVEKMEEKISNYLNGLTSDPAYQPAYGIKKLVFEIVGEALFGSKLGNEFDELRENMEFLNGFLTSRFSSLFPIPLSVPTPSHLKFKKARKALERIVGSMVERKKTELEQGSDAEDIVAKMIAAKDPETGESMSHSQLIDECISVLLAGFETTANLIPWILHLVSKNPETQKELVSEIDTGISPFQSVVLGNVIDEVLRMYPSVWALTKLSMEEDEIRGIRYPAKSIFFVSSYLMHRHPKYWDHPDEFIPSRWNSELREKNKNVYFPFGMGPRTCVGKHFAITELRLFLYRFFQKFTLEADPSLSVEPLFQLTIAMKSPLVLKLMERNR